MGLGLGLGVACCLCAMTPASGPQQRLEQIERHRRGGPADQLCEANHRCGRRRLSEVRPKRVSSRPAWGPLLV